MTGAREICDGVNIRMVGGRLSLVVRVAKIGELKSEGRSSIYEVRCSIYEMVVGRSSLASPERRGGTEKCNDPFLRI